MALKQILPKVFYTDIQIGLKFFIEGMGFTLGYHDDELYIVSRDEITFLLVQNEDSWQFSVKKNQISDSFI